MASFNIGKTPSIDELASHPRIEELLATLYLWAPFFTAGQVHEFLQPEFPSNISAHLVHKFVRILLHQLEDAELVGSDPVKLLPPVTIHSLPIFERADRVQGRPWSVSDDDLKRYSRISRERVPSNEHHKPARLYFVRDKGVELLRSKWGPDAFLKLPPGVSREKQFKDLLGRHLILENQATVSSDDIAGTDLTAIFNLNQLRFKYRVGNNSWHAMVGREQSREVCELVSNIRGCRTSVDVLGVSYGRNRQDVPNGYLGFSEPGSVTVIFLAPRKVESLVAFVEKCHAADQELFPKWWL